MSAKRFLLTLGLLIITLLGLDAGVNAALDHASTSSAQSSFTVYDEQGKTLYAYNGDLKDCGVAVQPTATFAVPRFLHRT